MSLSTISVHYRRIWVGKHINCSEILVNVTKCYKWVCDGFLLSWTWDGDILKPSYIISEKHQTFIFPFEWFIKDPLLTTCPNTILVKWNREQHLFYFQQGTTKALKVKYAGRANLGDWSDKSCLSYGNQCDTRFTISIKLRIKCVTGVSFRIFDTKSVRLTCASGKYE